LHSPTRVSFSVKVSISIAFRRNCLLLDIYLSTFLFCICCTVLLWRRRQRKHLLAWVQINTRRAVLYCMQIISISDQNINSETTSSHWIQKDRPDEFGYITIVLYILYIPTIYI
jgi:hypothetical protein